MGERKRMHTTLQPHKRKHLLSAAKIESQGCTYYSVYGDFGIARSMSCPIFQSANFSAPLFSPDIFTSTQLLYIIGRSNVSQVFLGRSISTTDYLAVKLIDTSKKEGQMAAKKEIGYLKLGVAHPNIVKYHGERSFERCTMIYEEYFPGIDLFYLLMQCKKVSVSIIKKIFVQIADAVSYLHKNRICHLDIKPENILVDRKCRVKLIDFGMAQVALRNGLVEAQGGSLHYTAPEAEQGGVYNGFLADSWSCGVVLFVMANKYFPRRANRSEHLPGTPEFIVNAVNHLLVINPEKRSPIFSFQKNNNEFYEQETNGE